MFDGSRLIALIFGVLVVTTAGYADMVPVSAMDTGLAAPPALVSTTNSSSMFGSAGMADMNLWSFGFLPEMSTDDDHVAAEQRPQITSNGPDSLALCLSALMGLGLCSSVHWVKRMSFGFVPEWYHNGGPFQIGHSHAINPSILCSVPTYCFIQPNCTADDTTQRCHLGAMASLWRESQCTTTTLGSRAPPGQL